MKMGIITKVVMTVSLGLALFHSGQALAKHSRFALFCEDDVIVDLWTSSTFDPPSAQNVKRGTER